MNQEQLIDLEYLKTLGADQVRLLLNSGQLQSRFVYPAVFWLAEIDAEEKSRLATDHAHEMKIARSAERAAWIAAYAAMLRQCSQSSRL